jgi:hypothetical protein
MRKALSPFEISLSNVNIMCDRGSNFVKCFKHYGPLHCFAHRLNNLLKKCFFQYGKKRRAAAGSKIQTATAIAAFLDEDDSSEDDSCYDTDDDDIPSIKLKPTKRETANNLLSNKRSASSQINHVTLDVSEVPPEARDYLEKLKEVKRIIKYVKKVSFWSTYYAS